MTRWTADRMPCLDGRVALVTGGNSGIGFRTADGLAAAGATVVLACRDRAKGAAAALRIRGMRPGAVVEVREVDLASIDAVRAFAETWTGPLDVLVNNAGVMAPPRPMRTVDGFELQFAVNHLAHYALTGLLLGALLEEPGARVVTVASIAHYGADATVVDANAGPGYDARRAYANSKLANLLFARQLHRQFSARSLPITSAAAHPGVAATGLVSDRQGMGANPVLRWIGPHALRLVGQPARAAARAVLFAASAAEPGSYTGPQRLGETRGRIGPARLSPLAEDEKLAHQLWLVSEDLTGFHYPWP